MAHPLNRQLHCLQSASRHGSCIVSVVRNQVPTIVSFGSRKEALRASLIMSSGVWVYKAKRECLFLESIAPRAPGRAQCPTVWATTGRHLLEFGMNSFGVDECVIDEDGCIVMARAFFINRDLKDRDLRRILAEQWKQDVAPLFLEGDSP
jgi:hypothetical protein